MPRVKFYDCDGLSTDQSRGVFQCDGRQDSRSD